jgi:quercetin dioxygenase-like cupin family protein
MTHVRIPVALLLFAALSAGASAQTAKKAPPSAPASHHTIVTAADLKWGPAPPGLPSGAQVAVLDGNPEKPGAFVIQAKFPDGYRVPPHWHPTTENLTVISGTFRVGMGDKIDEASMQSLGPGGFAKMPQQMHHYAAAKGETVVQIHGMGPFAITYVNPSDDPRKQTTATK